MEEPTRASGTMIKDMDLVLTYTITLKYCAGTYTWADGDKYTGFFVDGRRVGKGVLYRANGEIYDQEWKEEKFEEFNKGIPDDNENSTERRTPPVFCTKRTPKETSSGEIITVVPAKQQLEESSPQETRKHKKPRYS